MPIQPLDIFCDYAKQRFVQFGSSDAANFYKIQDESGKATQALYPTMGRRHVRLFNENKLVYGAEPRFIFRSIDFMYVIVAAQVIQIGPQYQEVPLPNADFNSTVGDIWFSYMTVNTQVYCMLTANTSAGRKVFIIVEATGGLSQMVTVTDTTNGPPDPTYIATFGNRFVVSVGNSPQFFLSRINLSSFNTGTGVVGPFNPNDTSQVFSEFVAGSPASSRSVFASASGKIGQLGVLHNQLYIFCDFVTDVWMNIPTQFLGVTFPFKLNTSYNFDYGIADPYSLDIDFGMMVWLAQNRNGLVSFMASLGQQPEDISTQAINVLLQNSANAEQDDLSPFLEKTSDGFLYQFENSVFYRVSAGAYLAYGQLDIEDSANCIEFNFNTKSWHRCIELNGERNRIQKHVYFNNKHLVTVSGDGAIYEMAGDIYSNELRTPDTDAQAANAFTLYPMRYELVTKQIFQPDYSEFITDYVEIDFVFGDRTFYKSSAPFDNTVYIVDEESVPEIPIFLVTEESTPGNEVFIIDEQGNLPGGNDTHYDTLFNPHVELYYSDDGGITYVTADLREFSALGQYRWRMRWYELSASRNRVYKLVCVSLAPIIVLGAVQNLRRVSGGAN
jgi:hypothetical protein